MRWRIERTYYYLKQELGLGHYEGRGWCGLHHLASLIHRGLRIFGQRTTRPPVNLSVPKNFAACEIPAFPENYIPRCSLRAALRIKLEQHDSHLAQFSVDRTFRTISLLRKTKHKTIVVTQ